MSAESDRLLTEDHVEEVFRHSISAGGESTSRRIIVDGVTSTAELNTERLQENRRVILGMLAELLEKFNDNNGSSYLNMPIGRDNRLWTNNPRTQEKLLLLGLATGAIAYSSPRCMWELNPDGIPNIRVVSSCERHY